VRSSIIAGNTAGDADDLNGQMRSRGYSLIQSLDGQAVITEEENAGTNITLVNPQLQPLADNGGPTMTHAVRANSPVIDKGRNFATDLAGNPLNTDQRGEQRPTDLVTFMNAMNGDGSEIGAYELVVPPVTPGQLIISEFRANGPGGPADDYVEIYNNTNSDLDVLAIDNSAGFQVRSTNNRSCLIPNGTVIKARGRFLCTGATYSLAAVAASDATFDGDVVHNTSLALFPRVQGFVSAEAIDRVAPVDAVGVEGTGLPRFTSTPGGEYAWMRDISAGTPRDTNNNAADFVLVSTNGGVVGGLQSVLGAPGPEGSGSPIAATSRFGILYLDPTAAPTAAPNRVRDLTPNPANNSTFGTLSIRRRFVNNTGGPVTRLRFRIINITGFPVTDASRADVRAITSVDAVINGNMVRGLTLETPPAQAFGGGLNSILSINTPLANGESIAVEFRLGVQKTGNYRFYVNVEALP
jgi:hypothetical protein